MYLNVWENKDDIYLNNKAKKWMNEYMHAWIEIWTCFFNKTKCMYAIEMKKTRKWLMDDVLINESCNEMLWI